MRGSLFALCLLLSGGAWAEPSTTPSSAPALVPEEALEEAPEEEEEPTFSYGVESDVMLLYVWRGIPLSAGAVNQPYAWVSAYGFELSFYGNQILNQGEDDGLGQFNEVGPTLTYAAEWKNFTFAPSVQFYLYPTGLEDPTGELSLKISYPVRFLSVFLNQAVDIAANAGGYYSEAGLEYEGEPLEGGTLAVSARVGLGSAKFNDFNIGEDKTALVAATTGAHLEYGVFGAVYVRPHLELSAILDGDLRDAIGSALVFNAGVALGVGI